MQHEVGVGGLLERGAEGGDQRVRQAVDEADGVRHQELAAVRTWRTSGSSVTNSALDASASARVRTLNSVVLPALV